MLDVLGVLSAPLRAESMLERMERLREVSEDEREAGERFQRLYRRAHLDPLKAADMMREVRSAGPVASNRVEEARRDVNAAMQTLGGHGSPAGSCAWLVLGDEITIAEWARREGWVGRPVSFATAKRTLILTLQALVEIFGVGPKKSA